MSGIPSLWLNLWNSPKQHVSSLDTRKKNGPLWYANLMSSKILTFVVRWFAGTDHVIVNKLALALVKLTARMRRFYQEEKKGEILEKMNSYFCVSQNRSVRFHGNRGRKSNEIFRWFFMVRIRFMNSPFPPKGHVLNIWPFNATESSEHLNLN